MSPSFRDELNPIWFSQDQGYWLCAGNFNDQVVLLYKRVQNGKENLSIFRSGDGLNFALYCDQVKFASSGKLWNISELKDCRLSQIDKACHLISSSCFALSSDLKKFIIQGSNQIISEPGVIVSHYKYNGYYTLYFGKESIKLALSKDGKSWYVHGSLAQPRGGFDSSPLCVLGADLTSAGILVVYDCSNSVDGCPLIQCGALLLSPREPNKIIWRSEVPLFDPHLENENTKVNPLGSAVVNKNLFLYWGLNDQDLLIISIPLYFLESQKSEVNLTKFSGNPIITPESENDWESIGTFNPAAIYGEGKVHIVYRAVGKNGISVLGYASSKNGFDINERSPNPIYYPREEFEGAIKKAPCYSEFAASGGSWGGCEDPKLTEIDDTIYMTYVAHNGYNLPRVALTSIRKKDFYHQNWVWSKPVLISAPGVIDKSGCILPEKVNGKFVIFHRVFPDILVDFVDELNFSEGNFLKGEFKIPPRYYCWDSRKISIGAPPIKTDCGWLVIYHAIDDRDPSRYKIGAMILSTEDPTKVLYRTPHPVLLPEEHYENEGKSGVVYPSGAVVIDGNLFVYYGGGDRVVCVATIPIKDFLDYLVKCDDLDPGFQKNMLVFGNTFSQVIA